MELRVEGANKLGTVAKALKDAGDKELRKELLRSLRVAGKKSIPDVVASAEDTLPHRGGLAAIVAGSKFAVRTRTSGRNPSVRVVGTSRHDLRSLDRGRLRHPVFGDREVWVTQIVPAGWFTDPLEERKPEMQREMLEALDRVADQIVRRVQ